MRKVFHIFLLLLFANNLFAEPIKMDEDKWNEIRNGLDYTEKVEVEEVPDEKPVEFENSKAPNLLPRFGGMQIIKVLGIIAIILFLVGLIIHFLDPNLFKSFRKNQKIRVNIDDPDYLDQSDLERALEYELDQSNFRACIRIYYLLLLESLDSQRKIHWKKDKTNRQYVLEIKEKPIRKNLKNMTKVYEEVWFGDYLLDQELYNHWSNKFQTIISQPSI